MRSVEAQGIGAIAAKVGARVETLGPDGQGIAIGSRRKSTVGFLTVPRADDDLAAILDTRERRGVPRARC